MNLSVSPQINLTTLRLVSYIFTIILVLSLPACDRVRKETHSITDRAKNKINDKKDAVIDKIVPTFDSYVPDTKYNKKRFEEFFGFAPTPDIKNIYCFDDQIGIDSKFLFSFKCDNSTFEKIVRNMNLTQASHPDNISSGLWQSFPWWDSTRISTLRPYWSKGEHEVYKYLWFDKSNQTAYYITYDL